jgi:hypothetical protein
MTYSVGGLIQASDYNTFRTNLNAIWSTGTTDSGWGQTAISSVAATGVVTATNWATLVNTLATAGSQTATTLTSRTAPTTGGIIAILSNVGTDISSVNARRGYAAASGTISSTWSGSTSYTSSIGGFNAGRGTPWLITWQQDIVFTSAAQARYFWNAGGLVRLDMSKTSTGSDIDPDWNTFVGTVGTLYVSGRVNSANQVIAGTTYTGFTRIGGSGTPSPNLTTTGWYSLTNDAAATTVFQLNSTVYPYTSDFIRIQAEVFSASTRLRLTTSWYQAQQFKTTVITGGTATTSPFTGFGTAATVLCRFIPPSNTYLTNTWGTPTVESFVIGVG